MTAPDRTFAALDRCGWCGIRAALDGGSDLCVTCESELIRLRYLREIGEAYLRERGIES